VARQHFADDRELGQLIAMKAAIAPAQTGVTGWAAELAAITIADVADNLLPATALSQLRGIGLAYSFAEGSIVRTPVHTPTPSGAFIAEGGAIPAGPLIITALTLKPRKAPAICAITKELMNGSPLNVELSLKTLLAEDVGLMIDGILLGNAAATTEQPPGLLFGLTPLAPTAGGGVNALLGDVKALMAAIAPSVRPVLVMSAGQAVTFSVLAPAAAVPVITAPYLAAGTVIALDAAAFASALGVPDFSIDENPTVHMSDTPLALVTGAQGAGVVAAPLRSLWQTACIGLRTLVDCDWQLRRAGAVAVVTGMTW
jgi:hypothetical protein